MELKPGVGSKTTRSCFGSLNKSPGFFHPRLSGEAGKPSQTRATAEDRILPGATLSRPHPVPLPPAVRWGGGLWGPWWCWGWDPQSPQIWALLSGRVTAPGDRRWSSTAVSSEVKVRARRARRVHTITQTRARSPLSTHSPGLGKHGHTPPAPSASDRNPPECACHRPRGPAAP